MIYELEQVSVSRKEIYTFESSCSQLNHKLRETLYIFVIKLDSLTDTALLLCK